MEPISRPGGRQAAILAIVALAAVGAYFGYRAWAKPPSKPSVEEGMAAAESFLAAVRTDAGKAWDQSTAEFKSIEGRESFVRKATSDPILREKLKFNSTQSLTVQDKPRLEFLYQSPTSGKPVRLLIGWEGGVWKVDRLTL